MKLRGYRTYISLAITGILGLAVALQGHCSSDGANAVCEAIKSPFIGQAIVVMTAIAAWFRKKA